MKSSHSIKNSIFPASKSRRSQSRQVSFHPSIPLSILAMLSLPASATIVLLDNTTGLTNTAFSSTSQTGWGSNSSAYNRINGYTFEVGSTSYDATAITIALRYGAGSITPNMRFSFWELPSLSANAPAGGAVPFYIQDNASNTINTTAQYFTYPLTNGTLNLKANTRYSIGITTDQTTNSASLNWSGYSPGVPVPSSAHGLTTTGGSGGFYSINGGTSFTGGTSMNYGFQLSGAEVSAVPEPTALLSTAGLLGAGLLLRRRSRKSL